MEVVVFCPECKMYIRGAKTCHICGWQRPPEAALPEPGEAYWRFETQGQILGSVVVSAGRLYVGSLDGSVYALDKIGGREVWRRDIGSPIEGGPAVEGELVCVGAYDGNIYTFDARTGREEWRQSSGGKIRSSPIIHRGTVYVGSGDGKLHALNVRDGRGIWQFEAQGVVRTTAAIGHGITFVGSYDRRLYAVGADSGKEVWRFRTEGPVTSSPTVWEDKLYFGSQDGNVYALGIRRGQLLWKFGTPDYVHSSPCVSDRLLYIGSNDGTIYGLDAETGEMRWQRPIGSAVASSPAVWNGIVFVGSNDGHIHALDARDGELMWRFRTLDSVTAGPVVDDGVIYVGSHDAHLYALPWHLGKWGRTAQHCQDRGQAEGAACYYALSGKVVTASSLFKGQGKHEFAAQLLEAEAYYTEAAKAYRSAAETAEEKASSSEEREAAGKLYTHAAHLFVQLEMWEEAVECRQRGAMACRWPLLQVECQPKSKLREGTKGVLDVRIINVGPTPARNIAITIQGESLRESVTKRLLELDPGVRERSFAISILPVEGGSPSFEVLATYQDRHRRSFQGRWVIWPWVESKLEQPPEIHIDKLFPPGTRVRYTSVGGDAVITQKDAMTSAGADSDFSEIEVGGDAIITQRRSALPGRKSEDPIPESKASESASGESLICPRCRQTNPPGADTCTNCGGELRTP